MVNNPPAKKETQVSSLGREGSLEKEMVTHFSGESHGQKSLVGYSPWGLKESDTTEGLRLLHFCHLWIVGLQGKIAVPLP